MSIEVDIRENEILKQDPVLLETILIDRSRPKNGSKKPQHIIWATDNYEPLGAGYGENEQISIDAITGEHGDIIQPRVRKTKAEQQSRIRDKAEVFTPSWICNAQNNLVDDYKEDEIYTWDYVMEQKAKAEWDKYHFGDPNPYAGLPKLNIYTFDLGKALSGFEDVEDSALYKKYGLTKDEIAYIESMIVPMDSSALFDSEDLIDPNLGEFNLLEHGVKVGDTIIYTPAGMELTVAEGNMVEYGGEKYTLAQFTAKYMPRNKRSVSGVCQGPRYFSYNVVSLYKLKESFLGGQES